MSIYLTLRIMDGAMDYAAIFNQTRFQKYKADVDAILAVENRQDLIVTIA